MDVYSFTNQETGQTVEVEWTHTAPPTEADIDDIFAQASAEAQVPEPEFDVPQQEEVVSDIPTAEPVGETEVQEALDTRFTDTAKVGPHPSDERDALEFSFRLGFTDTGRGVNQLVGDFIENPNTKEKEQQELFKMYQEQYGHKMTAAYSAGLMLDPGGFLIPGKKAETVFQTAINSIPAGVFMGTTGYTEEDQERTMNAILGGVGAFTIQGGMSKVSQTWGPVLSDMYQGQFSAPVKDLANNFSTWLKNNPSTKPTIDRMGEWFVDNYNLPKEFIKLKQGKRLTQGQLAARFNEVIKKTLDMTAEEQQMMYMLATGRSNETIPSNLSKLTDQGRQLVDDVGQMMVDLGMLNKTIYETNKGSYLHRTFANTSDPLTKSGIKNPKDILAYGNELMMRGHTSTIPREEVKDYVARGYRVVHGSADKKHHTIKVNRDWTEKELKQMGEIKNFAYAMSETGRLMTNDIAHFKFLDDVAKKFASSTEKEGYVRVPKASYLKGTKTERWGNLAGQWVPKEIYDNINRTNAIQQFFNTNAFGRNWKNIQTVWKRTKTSLNPVTHVNNVMSNMMLYDFVDGNYKLLTKAALDLSKRGTDKAPDDLKLAEELGVFHADQMTHELTQLERDIYRVYINPIETGATKDGILGGIMNKTKQIMSKTKDYLKETHLDSLYQAEDNVFRYGLFKSKLAEGHSAEEAAAYARKYMLDYEIDAPGIQVMRQTTHPFIAYTYRATPILAETMVNKPWKVVKWSGMLYGVNQYGELDVSDAQVKEERKLLEANEKGFSFFGLPGLETMVRLPGKEGEYLDTQRWYAGMDIMEAGRGAYELPYVPAVLEPSGGFVSGIYSGLTGMDFFTGKPIPGTRADTPIAFKEQLNATAKAFLPPWLGGYAWDKLQRGMDPGKHLTKQDFTPTEAAMNLFGIKKFTMDPQKEYTSAGLGAKTDVADLQRYIAKLEIEKLSTADPDKKKRLQAQIKEATQYAAEIAKEFEAKKLTPYTKK